VVAQLAEPWSNGSQTLERPWHGDSNGGILPLPDILEGDATSTAGFPIESPRRNEPAPLQRKPAAPMKRITESGPLGV
jgi:hypothetical protein